MDLLGIMVTPITRINKFSTKKIFFFKTMMFNERYQYNKFKLVKLYFNY